MSLSVDFDFQTAFLQILDWSEAESFAADEDTALVEIRRIAREGLRATLRFEDDE